MKSLKVSKLIFSSEDNDLLRAVNRPPAWPSFKFQSISILAWLEDISDWKISFERKACNKGVSLIALSVIKEDRLQSYIAT